MKCPFSVMPQLFILRFLYSIDCLYNCNITMVVLRGGFSRVSPHRRPSFQMHDLPLCVIHWFTVICWADTDNDKKPTDFCWCWQRRSCEPLMLKKKSGPKSVSGYTWLSFCKGLVLVLHKWQRCITFLCSIRSPLFFIRTAMQNNSNWKRWKQN